MSPCPDTVPADAGLARLPCICVVSVVGVPFKIKVLVVVFLVGVWGGGKKCGWAASWL